MSHYPDRSPEAEIKALQYKIEIASITLNSIRSSFQWQNLCVYRADQVTDCGAYSLRVVPDGL
jgi:hypothetical protein